MRAISGVLAVLALASVPVSPPDVFLTQLLAPGLAPQSLLPLSAPARSDTASYDAALACLWLLTRDRREEAGRVLAGLAAIQARDGGIAFSFPLPAPDPDRAYMRTGAMAWVGYACARYLDAAPGGPARPAVAAMAHRLAAYLLEHRVASPGDPRDGLITGGSGRYNISLDAKGEVLETFVPGEISWVSAEHNIDAWFFFRELARVTGDAGYESAAALLGDALIANLWSDSAGQFFEGTGVNGPDETYALDCASWGALFLVARGDRERAEIAYATAEQRYSNTDTATHVQGHRPYASRPVIENILLARHFKSEMPINDWDQFGAVWPEGGAGVALAAFRLGHRQRSRDILDALEPLRQPDGGLPGLSRNVPFDFSTAPAFGGTAWVELVRAELDATPGWPGGVWSTPEGP